MPTPQELLAMTRERVLKVLRDHRCDYYASPDNLASAIMAILPGEDTRDEPSTPSPMPWNQVNAISAEIQRRHHDVLTMQQVRDLAEAIVALHQIDLLDLHAVRRAVIEECIAGLPLDDLPDPHDKPQPQSNWSKGYNAALADSQSKLRGIKSPP